MTGWRRQHTRDCDTPVVRRHGNLLSTPRATAAYMRLPPRQRLSERQRDVHQRHDGAPQRHGGQLWRHAHLVRADRHVPDLAVELYCPHHHDMLRQLVCAPAPWWRCCALAFVVNLFCRAWGGRGAVCATAAFVPQLQLRLQLRTLFNGARPTHISPRLDNATPACVRRPRMRDHGIAVELYGSQLPISNCS